jgi:hypothetical protein
MSSWLETYKPVASSRFQLLLAGAMWTALGVALASVGGYWLLTSASDRILLTMLLAGCVGLGKSLLILDRAVHRFAKRIQLRGEDRCVGGFLSVKAWALVAGMMLLGRFLRSSEIPRQILGLLYAGVGTGLLLSSRIFWQAWLRERERESAADKFEGA